MVFLVSFTLTGILIPQILLIAFRKKLFDEPDERKIHKGVIPRLGGISFMPSIVFSIACATGFSLLFYEGMINVALNEASVQVSFGVCALMLLYLMGLADDLVGVRYRAKFVIQGIASVFLVMAGLYIVNLHGFCSLNLLPQWFAYAFTILVIIFITNAINLIDGIDGLASGLSMIACLFYGIIFYMNSDFFYALLMFATLGTLMPFFYYNVFGNPEKFKKIFMGDTGALTIGLVLSVASIHLSNNGVAANTTINPLIIAFSPLIVPGFDVVRVYLYRLRNRRNPFLPDKNHIHHKFLALGMRQSHAMLTILALSAFFILLNILMSDFVNITMIVVVDLFVFTCIQLFLSYLIHRHKAHK
ncbi:MAG: undecaprenyl/decaprenyl-phosphate alpha-N-acetylglucosaminyl 1-phosphate transferase [Muribaculaceae bacterium]|nr:undecaprenyl/decaprenyl-phosphate alpha-N-acetylglucosaminyl 1-phosphate transferase [Muribaculaceae bacterium]